MDITTAMLADAASVADGKLFVHGGGWDSIRAATFPVVHHSLALVFIVRIEYHEALVDIPLSVELLDEDDVPLGIEVRGTINAGHAPGSRPGSPTFVPNAFQFTMLKFDHPGSFRWKISSDERELASVVFHVAQQRQV